MWIQYKISRQVTQQENVTQRRENKMGNRSGPQNDRGERIDKDYTTAIINMLKDLKENMYTMKSRILLCTNKTWFRNPGSNGILFCHVRDDVAVHAAMWIDLEDTVSNPDTKE